MRVNDRCRQTHQSGSAGGGDGRRRDDQDHLGVHQREGEKVERSSSAGVSVGGGYADTVWITYFYITARHVNGEEEGIICVKCGGGTCMMFQPLTGWLPPKESRWHVGSRMKTWRSMKLKLPHCLWCRMNNRNIFCTAACLMFRKYFLILYFPTPNVVNPDLSTSQPCNAPGFLTFQVFSWSWCWGTNQVALTNHRTRRSNCSLLPLRLALTLQ